VHHVDPAAEQSVAEAQRIAVDLDQPDVGQQVADRRRIEMLSTRQPVWRVDTLPIFEQALRPGIEVLDIDDKCPR
jgi:hypothetical protein